MIDEQGKRRPECDEANSVAVRLADGQEWLFPRPMLELRAAFRDGKAVSAYPVRAYDRELEELVEALGQCTDDTALLCGAATLGAWLLARNYELTDDELNTLFVGRPSDPASWEWVQEVMAVATSSHRPKPSAVGCG
jgi:hypothetical protein